MSTVAARPPAAAATSSPRPGRARTETIGFALLVAAAALAIGHVLDGSTTVHAALGLVIGLTTGSAALAARPPASGAARTGRAVAAAALVLAAAVALVPLLAPGSPTAIALVGPAHISPGPGGKAHALIVAGALALVAAAFAAPRTPAWDRRARGLAVIGLVLGTDAALVVALGRAFPQTSSVTIPALPAFAAVVLAGQVLLRDPERAPWRWVVGASPGARAARIGLPLGVMGPLLMSTAVYATFASDRFTAAEASSLMLVSFMGFAIAAVALVARSLDRHHDLRALADEAVRGSAGAGTLATFHTDAGGRIVSCDAHFADLVGATDGELDGGSWIVVAAVEQRPVLRGEWLEARRDGTALRREIEVVDAEGRPRALELTLRPVRLARPVEGGPAWVGTCIDVTRLRAAETGLEQAARRRAAAEDRSPSGFLELDLEGRVLGANRSVCAMLGRDEPDLVGRPILPVLHGDDAGRVTEAVEGMRLGRLHDDGGELTYAGRGGVPRRVRYTAFPILDGDGRPERVVVHCLDVTAQHRVEAKLERLLHEDATTGLRSRQWFEQALTEAVAATRGEGMPTVVALLDIDRFRDVNDGYGSALGDRVLTGVAEIVRDETAGLGAAARLGGDEMAVLLTGAGLERAELVVRGVLDRVAGLRWEVPGGQVHVSVSAGIVALAPEDAADPDAQVELTALAEAALHDAKAAGTGRVVVAGETSGALRPHRERLAWAERLRHALEHGGLAVHYQPIARVGDGVVNHMEALVRLDDRPGERPVPPGAFLEVAERYDLLPAVDRFVRDTVIADFGACRIPPGFTVSVNVSAPTIDDPGTARSIERSLEAARVPGDRLVLEVTETTAIRDVEVARRFAERVGDLGCRMALDDFGTGHASFASLKQISYDTVKVDGSWVRGLVHDPADRLLVQAVVDLSRGMGMRTVAEMVEDAETWNLLAELGVDMIQGYYLGRPRPLAEALADARAFVPPQPTAPRPLRVVAEGA